MDGVICISCLCICKNIRVRIRIYNNENQDIESEGVSSRHLFTTPEWSGFSVTKPHHNPPDFPI